jgi:hypothetical protein
MAVEERRGPDVMFPSRLGSLLPVALFASQPIPSVTMSQTHVLDSGFMQSAQVGHAPLTPA